MEGLFSILIWGILLFIFLTAKKKKGKTQAKNSLQSAVNEARKQAGRYADMAEKAGREQRGSRAGSGQPAPEREETPEKQAMKEAVRTGEALQRKWYSYKGPEERRAISSFDPSMQDDQHDWLAKQLKDEQKSYREVSEMFEAKLSHLSSCAAENNRLDHTLHCDARRLAEDSRMQ